MYIARKRHKGITNYYIHESYKKDRLYLHRELVELGPDPGVYIHYPAGRSFYIDEIIEDELLKKNIVVDYDRLEEIFLPYVKAEVRRRYEQAFSRGKTETSEHSECFGHHEFDKRRFLFLKSGNINQKNIESMPDKYFQFLNEKSRDEIEQLFIMMEKELKIKELKTYIYVVFNLQRHFNTLYAREMPQALNQDEVARHLIDDICRINSDKTLWQGLKIDFFLNDYLIRYLIMFFDYEFEKSSFLDDLQFARFTKRRYHRQYARPVDEVFAEAGSVFGVPESELKKMTKRQLKKLFRKKAQEIHPDKGGDHDEFVELSRMYDELMGRIG